MSVEVALLKILLTLTSIIMEKVKANKATTKAAKGIKKTTKLQSIGMITLYTIYGIIQNMKRVFLDYASITPLDKKVEEEMIKVQKKFWANPSSLHTEGEMAKNVLEEARIRIARILHCRASEIFFTSGGTESLNLAILGIVKNSQGLPLGNGDPKGRPWGIPHIIVSTIEHPAVLEPIKFLLKNKEIEVSFVAPNEKGMINPESIKKEIKENTILVIVQHANNEIGTIQPIQKIAEIIRTHKKSQGFPLTHPYLLVDACQSVLYENVSLERLGADLLVLDGIKMYGPRGMGILAIKHGTKISPIVFGGGQEGGLRSGTENVPGAVGLAKALEIGVKMREKETKRLTTLRDYAINKILKEILPLRQGSAGQASLNGSLENRLPNNINVCFPGQDSEFLVIKLDTLGFAVSAASACHTLSLENGSYVIESLGKPECASSSLRITLGRSTKKSDLDKFISALKKLIK
jgi:cysteine desulfurase